MSDLPRIVPAAVTPFSEGGDRLRLEWIPEHLAYLERRGADGVLTLGTNGEGPSLTLRERKDTIDTVLARRGRLRTFVGTGCASLPETIELSRYAIERGADAALVVPPFYFKQIDPQGLIAYYGSLLDALSPVRKVILYNIPDVSGVEISDELVDALVERHPERLLGVKDTSGSLERTRRYVERYPQLVVYSGGDRSLAGALEAGVHGAISGGANVLPDRFAAVISAHDAGEDVAALQAGVDSIHEAIRGLPSHSAIKHLLHLVAGLPLTYVRPPLRDLTPDEVDVLSRRVEEFGLA
jgi:4-hydroxy-tetrahydrodipicolinate synthase